MSGMVPCVRCGQIESMHGKIEPGDAILMGGWICPIYVEPAPSWMKAVNALLGKINDKLKETE